MLIKTFINKSRQPVVELQILIYILIKNPVWLWVDINL